MQPAQTHDPQGRPSRPFRRLLGRALLPALVLALGLGLGPARAGQPAQEIVAVVPASLPPIYASQPDGTPTGFAVEVLRRVARDAGYSVRLTTTEVPEEAKRRLLGGRAQILPGMGVSPARAERVDFTQAFEMLPVHIYFRAGGTALETVADLRGRRVSLVAGSIEAEQFTDDAIVTRHISQSLPDALFEVLSGETDALVFAAPLVEYAAHAAGMGQTLVKSTRPLFEVSRAIAVRKDQPELLARLDKSLEAFRDTEEFRDLYRRWHAPPAPPALPPTVLWSMGALLAGLASVLLAWRSLSLWRMNRKLVSALSQRDQAAAELRLTRERLEALFTLAHMETADTDGLIHFALEEAVRLTGSQIGYLFFMEGGDIDLSRFYWSTGAKHSCTMPNVGVYPLSKAGLWADCVRTKVPCMVNDYAASPQRRGLPEGHVPVERHMAVPLLEGEAVAAVLGVGNKAEPYDDNDTRQLQLFLVGLWRVLRARRDAEAILQARDYAESLIQGANAMIIGTDSQGRATLFNAAAEEISGYTREEVLGRNLYATVMEPEATKILNARHQEFMAGHASLPRRFEVLLRTKDGATRNVALQCSLLQAGDTVTGVIAFGIDVTERKQAEAELRRLHSAIEQAAEGVLITDENGIILYINAAFERMTGLAQEGIPHLGLSVFDLDLAALEHQHSMIRSDDGEGTWRGSCAFARPSAPTVEMDFTVSAIRGQGDRLMSYVAVCRDVTEKRLLEHQLWQAQKMEALGTLAGGIAHDFNNILASIMGFAELALDDAPPLSRARASLERVLKASLRARELVRQILSFSRRSERKVRQLHADSVVAEALKLLEVSLPKEIEFDTLLLAGPCSILADPSQVHQIIMNLCTNAAQAMGGVGGRIAVRTSVRPLAPDQAARHRLPPGQYLTLAVEDQGPGIAPDVLGRIFDPFFTTKAPGEGTGLGLAVVHGIVSSLGGAVLAESEFGQGARFLVLLPAQDACEEPPQESRAAGPAGQGRILVVDDEPDLLELVRQTLEPLGYKVRTTNDPEAALAELLARPQDYDLVITDQSMPRLTGLQLAERLRVVRPGLPIVLCSGLSRAIPQDRLQSLGAVWLLHKPFSKSELAQTVRLALANLQGGET